ncbi:uncharacterized protein LOC120001000 isoform X1 [Tripterygium wilfordii]|nr:uncharacterized protein LOC120001000 isoform X1 [Tripterygium wilfordii]
MTAETNTLSYWLNWRFFLCALWVFTSMVGASFLIWKFEGNRTSEHVRRENQRAASGSLYEDEAWKTCLKDIHPVWLLCFRIVAFTVLLSLITANVVIDGGGIFYFYTQWTFTLVTFYFGLGSSISIYRCCKTRDAARDDQAEHTNLETEQGTYVASAVEETTHRSHLFKSSNSREESRFRPTAGVWSYVFQITFQICAGAVLLTDGVFWLFLYPLLSSKDYTLSFMMVSMHSVNAVFVIGDTILNSMRFPMFRIAYFVLWTGIFVIFQWIIHACVSLWWPYPFLDLSSPYAPLWYLAVGLTHIPCYGIFALIVKGKHYWLSGKFRESYQS